MHHYVALHPAGTQFKISLPPHQISNNKNKWLIFLHNLVPDPVKTLLRYHCLKFFEFGLLNDAFPMTKILGCRIRRDDDRK